MKRGKREVGICAKPCVFNLHRRLTRNKSRERAGGFWLVQQLSHSQLAQMKAKKSSDIEAWRSRADGPWRGQDEELMSRMWNDDVIALYKSSEQGSASETWIWPYKSCCSFCTRRISTIWLIHHYLRAFTGSHSLEGPAGSPSQARSIYSLLSSQICLTQQHTLGSDGY